MTGCYRPILYIQYCGQHRNSYRSCFHERTTVRFGVALASLRIIFEKTASVDSNRRVSDQIGSRSSSKGSTCLAGLQVVWALQMSVVQAKSDDAKELRNVEKDANASVRGGSEYEKDGQFYCSPLVIIRVRGQRSNSIHFIFFYAFSLHRWKDVSSEYLKSYSKATQKYSAPCSLSQRVWTARSPEKVVLRANPFIWRASRRKTSDTFWWYCLR